MRSLSNFASLCIGLAGTLLVLADAEAQISTPPRPTADYVNAVGFGLSYGEISDREADFWGWSLDYSRLLNDSWTAALSLAWDEEIEQFIDQPDKAVRSYTFSGLISYNLTQNFSLTTGLAQGIADDNNATGTMKVKSGDVSTGLSLGYSWPLNKRNSINASLAYEYSISENEPSASIDVSLGWSF